MPTGIQVTMGHPSTPPALRGHSGPYQSQRGPITLDAERESPAKKGNSMSEHDDSYTPEFLNLRRAFEAFIERRLVESDETVGNALANMGTTGGTAEAMEYADVAWTDAISEVSGRIRQRLLEVVEKRYAPSARVPGYQPLSNDQDRGLVIEFIRRNPGATISEINAWGDEACRGLPSRAVLDLVAAGLIQESDEGDEDSFVVTSPGGVMEGMAA